MAVIARVSNSMCSQQGIILFLVVSWTGTVMANPRGCDSIRNNVTAKGFTAARVLEKPETGSICDVGSCCSEELENEMHRYSQLYLEKYLKNSILKISSLIDTRARKFDEFFREMMNNSKREFHGMFERTYGKIYLQNADVFSDFFTELETYYKKGTVRLSETMDTFFGILYQRMFTVLNAQYTFDDKYLECVSDHMAEMKPFGDVPHKLGVQLRRSFVATRTLYKSLTKGADVTNALIGQKVDEECGREMMRMQYCGLCGGEETGLACAGYCTDVLEACLRHYKQISPVWDGFVDAIEKVSERLLGPYNIEVVVEPLNIKISEAIMNFQESGTEVSQKIYIKCGKPLLVNNRSRRKAEYKDGAAEDRQPNMEITYEPIKGHGKKKHHKKVQEKADGVLTLEKLIADIKMKIKDTKQFWLQLPYQYCNNDTISASPSENGRCWNGTTVGTYEKTKQTANPVESPLVSEQIYILQSLTDKLRKAYQGQEVEIVDDTEEPLTGSGSGSGDGHDDENDDEEEEADSNDRDDDHEGSVDLEEPRVHVNVPAATSPTTTTRKPEVVRTSGGSSANSMSLTRALLQYLIPIVMAWIGGAMKDLL